MARTAASVLEGIPLADTLRVLLVEDSDTDAALLEAELRRQGFLPHIGRVESEPSLRAALSQPWDVVLADYSLPRFDAVGALAVSRSARPTFPSSWSPARSARRSWWR